MKGISVLLTLDDPSIKFCLSAITTIILVIHEMSVPSKPLTISLFMIFTRHTRIYTWHKSLAISGIKLVSVAYLHMNVK